jgi:hypothetical protein
MLSRDFVPYGTVFITMYAYVYYFDFPVVFFPVPVCAITASGVPGGTLVSMSRFSTLCGWLVQRQGRRVKGRIWQSEQARSARANSWLDCRRPLEKQEMGEEEMREILSVHPCGSAGRDSDHSLASSAEVENERRCTSSPFKRLHGVRWVSFSFYNLFICIITINNILYNDKRKRTFR